MNGEEIEALERQLSHLDQRIEDLEGRMARAGLTLRQAYQAELRSLRDEHRRAEAEIARLRREEAESWEREDLQGGILAIFDDLGARLDRLFGEVNREGNSD